MRIYNAVALLFSIVLSFDAVNETSSGFTGLIEPRGRRGKKGKKGKKKKVPTPAKQWEFFTNQMNQFVKTFSRSKHKKLFIKIDKLKSLAQRNLGVTGRSGDTNRCMKIEESPPYLRARAQEVRKEDIMERRLERFDMLQRRMKVRQAKVRFDGDKEEPSDGDNIKPEVPLLPERRPENIAMLRGMIRSLPRPGGRRRREDVEYDETISYPYNEDITSEEFLRTTGQDLGFYESDYQEEWEAAYPEYVEDKEGENEDEKLIRLRRAGRRGRKKKKKGKKIGPKRKFFNVVEAASNFLQDKLANCARQDIYQKRLERMKKRIVENSPLLTAPPKRKKGKKRGKKGKGKKKG